MASGRLRKDGKVYRYDADFDETTEKWFGYATANRSAKILHKTEPLDSFAKAIIAIERWVIDEAQ